MKKTRIWMLTAILSICGYGLLLSSCSHDDDPVPSPAQKSIVIIFENDVHCAIDGYKRIAGLRDAIGSSDTAWAAAVSCGDYLQGGSPGALSRGAYIATVMNRVGYDVITLGNHEFDNGIEALGELLPGLGIPVVVCNYDFSSFKMGQYVQPYVIIEKANRKIGVIGVLCNLKDMVAGDIANRIQEFDMIPTVQRYVDEIRPQCDLVIALTHIGYEEHNPGDTTDPMLVAATRGIDLVVGGHSHTFMDAPAYVKNLDGKKVPIVQAGWMGTQMGELHLK